MPRNRHYDVHALSAAGLQPALQPQLVQHRQHQFGGFDHAIPGQLGIRVQIQNDAVRLVDIAAARTPGMKLDSAHLHCTYQGLDVVHLHIGRMLRVERLIQVADVGNGKALCVFLEELLLPHPTGRTQQRYRAPAEMRHDPFAQACIKAGQFTLGETALLINDAIRVADAYPGNLA